MPSHQRHANGAVTIEIDGSPPKKSRAIFIFPKRKDSPSHPHPSTLICDFYFSSKISLSCADRESSVFPIPQSLYHASKCSDDKKSPHSAVFLLLDQNKKMRFIENTSTGEESTIHSDEANMRSERKRRMKRKRRSDGGYFSETRSDVVNRRKRTIMSDDEARICKRSATEKATEEEERKKKKKNIPCDGAIITRKCFLDVDDQIIIKVSEFLDLKTLCRMRAVCRRFGCMVGSIREMWMGALGSAASRLLIAATAMSESSQLLRTAMMSQAAGNRSFRGINERRFGFLHATSMELLLCAHDLNRSRPWTSSLGIDPWLGCRLIHSATENSDAVAADLRGIVDGKRLTTENFDIYEMTMKRACDELRCMIPLFPRKGDPSDATAPPGHPSEIIRDRSACDAWMKMFGTKAFVGFEEFRAVISADKTFQCLAIDEELFSDLLRYVLDFPRCGIVTTYRFDVFTTMFGPMHSLAENFSSLVLSHGFVGFVNMIQAEEILKRMHPATNVVLVRFSRGIPGCMSFSSYRARDGACMHRRNIVGDETDPRIVCVSEFLSTNYTNYELARVKLDPSVASGVMTMSRYASTNDFYCCYV
jgi:hypothetical protein